MDKKAIESDPVLLGKVMEYLARITDEFLKHFMDDKSFSVLVYDREKPKTSYVITTSTKLEMIAMLRKTADMLEEQKTMPPVLPGVH